MKKSALVFLLSFVSFISFAQVQRQFTHKNADSANSNEMLKGKNNQEDRKQMMRELNLTKEQREKIKEIRQANQAKKEAIENDTTLTAEQKETRLRELKREMGQSMLPILNDEQKAKFKEMRDKRQQQIQ
ncbi:MAG TPA: hypothetical protein VKH37_03440 [Ferruginibacter sp.]|nr:hypothetical protein [Ferruginibacter sp.]